VGNEAEIHVFLDLDDFFSVSEQGQEKSVPLTNVSADGIMKLVESIK
jgi:hypothetical protein